VGILIVMLLFLLFSGVLNAASQCKVADPELQGSYAGPCIDGLAEGAGAASGTAEYRGGFKSGRKHGQGVKTWANGDRYEGRFYDDRRQGFGVYAFGRGPWAGERYEGEFLADRRHGEGVYRWPSGDVYSGPWRTDIAVGPPTPMMRARENYERETRAAVSRIGAKVCREMKIGIAGSQWLRATVTGVRDGKISVRIDDPAISAGTELWDAPLAWTACW
jgi:hypothetical protein